MFESEYAKIEYIRKLNVVYHIWKKECHSDDYRIPVQKSLELLRENQGSVFVVDARNGFEDTSDDVKWGFDYFLPELKKTGCKEWIFILNEVSDIEGEIDMWTLEIKKYFKVRRVTSFDEAVETLEESNCKIQRVKRKELPECVDVIKKSFQTVADEFGFTMETAPRFTAFSTTVERLQYQLEEEQRSMYAFYEGDKLCGYYSLLKQENKECELNNLAVLPEYRHQGIGEVLFIHAVESAKDMGCTNMNIGIVEENTVLRKWYEKNGAEHIGTKKFDFFPFTCGYMKKQIKGSLHSEVTCE